MTVVKGHYRTKDVVDEVAGRELKLFIDNDYDLYRQQYTPIIQNLSRKKYKGIYDHNKAVKLFMYLVDNGAKKYYREFGGGDVGMGWNKMFTMTTRKYVAEELTRHFEVEFNLGNYSKYKQKYLA